MGPVYEALLRELLPHLYRARLVPVRPVEVGAWWSGKAEVDVVARDPGRATAFIEVKWRSLTADEVLEALRELEAKASESGLLSPENYYVLAVRSVERLPFPPKHYRLIQLAEIDTAISSTPAAVGG